MTTLLVFIAVLAAGGVALAVTGVPGSRRSAKGPGPDAAVRGPGLTEPDPRLPAVLLPDQVMPADIGRLRFSVAFRGYRMDQVDAVLARLESALAERDAALAAVDPPQPKTAPRDPEAPS